MPFRIAGGKSRSSSTAAIGIETFIGSGLPQTSATTGAVARASATCAPGGAALVGERQDALGARVDRLVQRVAEARHLAAGGADRRHAAPRRSRPRASARKRPQASAVPSTTEPQPRMPAATAACSTPGSAA